MAQWLRALAAGPQLRKIEPKKKKKKKRALAALPEYLGSMPSNHMVARNCL